MNDTLFSASCTFLYVFVPKSFDPLRFVGQSDGSYNSFKQNFAAVRTTSGTLYIIIIDIYIPAICRVNYYFGVNANVVLMWIALYRVRLLRDAKIHAARGIAAHARVADNLWFACSNTAVLPCLPRDSFKDDTTRGRNPCATRYLCPHSFSDYFRS